MASMEGAAIHNDVGSDVLEFDATNVEQEMGFSRFRGPPDVVSIFPAGAKDSTVLHAALASVKTVKVVVFIVDPCLVE